MSPGDDRVSALELDPDPTLSTTQVGELFGVHPSTVKRWCERGHLEFHRTDGGHRRIRLSEALRRGPGGAIASQLAGFGEEAGSVWLAEQVAIRSADFEPGRDLARGWLDDRAFSRIRDLLLYLGRNHPELLPAVLDGVVREVMREVGRWWEEGRIGVGGEHLVSETLIEALFQLRRELVRTPATDRPVAMVGCSEGERHSIGCHCLRLLLEQGGWEVRFLGAEVPVDSWSGLQKAYRARLVCISFSSLRAWGDVIRTVHRLADTHDPALPYALALGGGMVPPKAPDIGAGALEELAPLPEGHPFDAIRVFPGTSEFMAWTLEREWVQE